jgi:hypothetical protein
MDAKTIYAQSSDIKSRTYLEYRRDMKKKAIAELEIMDWLQKKLIELYPKEIITVSKSGGDSFLWFLRKGGITREADFLCQIGSKQLEIEFQYADREDLNFYDFKTSKVAKSFKGKKIYLDDKEFLYIHKILKSYTLITPQWIVENGEYGMVPAWRSYAYRVPKKIFESILIKDESLSEYIERIDAKNTILNFQHQQIDIYKNQLSHLLQKVIDEDELYKLSPDDLNSFFEICFILDNFGKIPHNANLWLVYILSYFNYDRSLSDVAKIVYCIDYLYSKIELKENELTVIVEKVEEIFSDIKLKQNKDGYYFSSPLFNHFEETRLALFAINLLEDIVQDILFYYDTNLFTPIYKIYQNVDNIVKVAEFITKNINVDK